MQMVYPRFSDMSWENKKNANCPKHQYMVTKTASYSGLSDTKTCGLSDDNYRYRRKENIFTLNINTSQTFHRVQCKFDNRYFNCSLICAV